MHARRLEHDQRCSCPPEKLLAALSDRFLLASLPLAEGCPEGERRREVVCRPHGFQDVLVEAGCAPGIGPNLIYIP